MTLHTLRTNKRLLTAVSAAFAFAVCLLVFPSEAAAGVSDGLELCLGTVVPSLFPMMCLSAFLVRSGACAAVGRRLSPLTRLLFGQPGAAGAVIAAGLLCGYPVGAQMAAALFERGELKRADAHRLMLFCVNAGPAFVLGAVGEKILSDRVAGLCLFVCVTLSSLCVGAVSRLLLKNMSDEVRSVPRPCGSSGGKALSEVFTESVASASGSLAALCPWIVLFSCASRLLTLLPESADGFCTVLTLALEVGSGCSTAARLRMGLPVIAAVLAFGGFSVHCQNMRSLRAVGMSYRRFLAARVACAALSAGLCRVALLLPFGEKASFLSSAAPTASATSFSMTASAGLLLMGLILLFELDFRRRV